MSLDFDAFTYITGVAGLLGLLLQLKDSFPEHREARKTIVYLVIGIFIGSVTTSLRGVRVELGATISPFEVLVGVFVIVLAIAAITGAFTSESARRAELFAFSGIGTLALFILLMFGGASVLEDGRADRDLKKVSIEELIDLSALNASRGSFERALIFLEEAKSRLPVKDDRRQALDDRIKEIKIKQVSAR